MMRHEPNITWRKLLYGGRITCVKKQTEALNPPTIETRLKSGEELTTSFKLEMLLLVRFRITNCLNFCILIYVAINVHRNLA